MFIAGVNDTGEKLFSGVNDTAEKLFTGVNDTAEFKIQSLGVKCTKLSS